MTDKGDRVRLDRAGEFLADVPRSELLDLYRVVIDEYRFQVRLNWDRTQYLFVLSAAVMTAGGTVLATLKESGAIVALAIFAVGCATAILGRQVVVTGHEYYRRIVYRKTLIEDLLGRLHRLPGYHHEDAGLHLSTTGGMQKTRKILDETGEYFAEPLRRGTITHSMRMIFGGFLAIDIVGIGAAVYRLVV